MPLMLRLNMRNCSGQTWLFFSSRSGGVRCLRFMKGWIDRVFSVGTVYGRGSTGLQGRKALLSVTASGHGDREAGVRHVKAELSHVLDNMFALAKLEPLDPVFVFGLRTISGAERANYLKEYQERLLTIASEV